MATENPLGHCVVCVDMGTTNTRVWLVRKGEVLARAQANVGVRDTARDGSSARIRSALRDLIMEMRGRAGELGDKTQPGFVAAAGMITSPLGLGEVPHVFAPAGLKELASGVRCFRFPDVTDLPVLLLPGVRSGPEGNDLDSILQKDVMRGEETLCAGLVKQGMTSSPVTVLNLGSHWKAVHLDEAGRIAGSLTSLSGELIHAVQTQTILASALPQGRPASVDLEWCESGMAEQQHSGLPRALFGVRLMEINKAGSAEQRLSFTIGAFIAADFDALKRRGMIRTELGVVLSGSQPLGQAWRAMLSKFSIPAKALSEAETETALLGGLRAITDLFLQEKGDELEA